MWVRHLLGIIFILAFFASCIEELDSPISQSQVHIINKVNDLKIRETKSLSNGGFLIAGNSENKPYVQCVNHLGNETWSYVAIEYLGSYNSIDNVAENQVLLGGEEIVGNNIGFTSGLLTCFDKEGKYKWTKLYSEDSAAHFKINTLVFSPNTNSYFAIVFKSKPQGLVWNQEYTLAEFDINGNIVQSQSLDAFGVSFSYRSLAFFNNTLFISGYHSQTYNPVIGKFNVVSKKLEYQNLDGQVSANHSFYNLKASEHGLSAIQIYSEGPNEPKTYLATFNYDLTHFDSLYLKNYNVVDFQETGKELICYGQKLVDNGYRPIITRILDGKITNEQFLTLNQARILNYNTMPQYLKVLAFNAGNLMLINLDVNDTEMFLKN
ncbi:MAG: hypothetical protein KDC92_04970 [Bacteroidetes bacterium]|nr:hypothetical protein [Bacteroidota bacterium]